MRIGDDSGDIFAEVAVVGAGLIGSAAARYLAVKGIEVVLVGPDEPRDWQSHNGVFASHYDVARITRLLDRSPIWAELARRSMAVYSKIAIDSGISFHQARGFLRVDPPVYDGSDLLSEVEAVSRDLGIDFSRMDSVALTRAFPFFAFPGHYAGLYERGQAGIIDPEALIRAQITLFERAGGRLVRDYVPHCKANERGVILNTADGRSIRSNRVLFATGAFGNYFELLPQPPPLRVELETVWLARVDEVARLAEMPSLWCDVDWHQKIPYIYMLPPVRYPDGHWYVKVGTDRDAGAPRASLQDIQRYFANGGNPERTHDLRQVLAEIVPMLHEHRGHAKPCVLAYTAHGYPYIDQVNDRAFVAVGGCGSAAKSSDEIGRLAAALIASGTWSDSLAHQHFQVPR